MPPVTLTLIGKPGCHLCDDAREVIRSVIAELPADAVPIVEEKNILEDPVLHEQYVEDIPVVQLDGRNHTYWRVDPARLRAVLLEAR